LHLEQYLLAEYLKCRPGANDIGQHDTAVKDSLETIKKVFQHDHFQTGRSLLFLFYCPSKRRTVPIIRKGKAAMAQ